MTAAGADDADRKREGTSRTTSATADYVVLGADPSLPCSGDSGGPVLIATSGGEELATVVSRGDAECSTESKATRVDSNRAFIDAQLEPWRPGSVAIGERCLTLSKFRS